MNKRRRNAARKRRDWRIFIQPGSRMPLTPKDFAPEVQRTVYSTTNAMKMYLFFGAENAERFISKHIAPPWLRDETEPGGEGPEEVGRRR